jgi:hypothetical protein
LILDEEEQNLMEEKLRQKLKEIIEKRDLMNYDWDNEPIPKYFCDSLIFEKLQITQSENYIV